MQGLEAQAEGYRDWNLGLDNSGRDFWPLICENLDSLSFPLFLSLFWCPPKEGDVPLFMNNKFDTGYITLENATWFHEPIVVHKHLAHHQLGYVLLFAQ